MAKKKAAKKAVKVKKVGKVGKRVAKATKKKAVKKVVKKAAKKVVARAARKAAPKPTSTPAPAAPAPPPPPSSMGSGPEQSGGSAEGPAEPPSPATTLPRVGERAPAFALPDQTGRVHTLEAYRGKKVVLYFYPKDETSGCTAEACGFRDRTLQFQQRNVVVLGVSPDPVDSHRAFAGRLGLTFPLLADPDRTVIERYGVWQARPASREAARMGVARTTFIIDENGRIAQVFRNVSPAEHAQEILDWLDRAR